MSEKEKSTVKQKRLQEQAAAEKKKKSFRIKMIVFVALFIIISAAVLVLTSDGFYRNCTAVEVNGTKWSIADFNFHYYYHYTLLKSEVGALATDSNSEAVPESGKSLKKQVFNTATGETWHEYLTDMAIETMKEVTVIYNQAVEAGHELTADEKTSLTNEISMQQFYANYNGIDMDTFITLQYGNGVNLEVYEENLTKLYMADSYSKAVETAYEYSAEQLDSYYAENDDAYDVYNYRTFYVRANATDDAAMAKAKADADEFASKVTDEATFAELCREYSSEANAEMYKDDDASLSASTGEAISGPYAEWLAEDVRKEGDVEVIQGPSGYYVVYFISRDTNDYNAAKIEYFYVETLQPDASLYETTEKYEEAVALYSEETALTVEDMREAWVGGDDFDTIKSKFIEFIFDSGANEGVGRLTYDKKIAQWLFDEERTEGDVTVVETKEGIYYVIKYNGTGNVYSRVVAQARLARADYEKWVDESIASCKVKTTMFMGYAL